MKSRDFVMVGVGVVVALFVLPMVSSLLASAGAKKRSA